MVAHFGGKKPDQTRPVNTTWGVNLLGDFKVEVLSIVSFMVRQCTHTTGLEHIDIIKAQGTYKSLN